MFEKLKDIVELYKNKKISNLVLEKEISMAMASNIDIDADVVDPVSATSNITFGVALLPDKINGKFRLKMVIDKRIFDSRMADSSTLTRMLLENFKHREAVLSEFNKLLKKDVSLLEKSSIYISLLKIYKTSLEINRKICNEYPEILRILPTIETLDADIEMMEKDEISLAQKIEKLVNDGFLPQPFRAFAERVEELCRVELEKYVAQSDKPTMNKEYDILRGIADPPYNNNYKTTEIPYNYIPRN